MPSPAPATVPSSLSTKCPRAPRSSASRRGEECEQLAWPDKAGLYELSAPCQGQRGGPPLRSVSARPVWSPEFHQCGTNTPVNGRCVRPTWNRKDKGIDFVSFFLTINLTVVTSGPVRATGCKVRQRTVTPPGRPMPGSIPGSPTSFPNNHGVSKLRRSLPIG